ncbi:MAG: ATP-binding cassette domain-containing protein [Alphaproteobacteria bacterium]|nr:ATP-binding cassette domain-containing protein [Alphaproteobacteria bacterium]
MIVVDGLTKRFGPRAAVDHVSFKVKRGEVLGFLGPNGAGKSTTMKMITGFLAPSSGRVAVCGFDLEDAPLEAKKRIGYLPEGAPAYPDMTPAGFLDFIARIRGFDGAERQKRVIDAAAKTQLGDVFHQPIETLSKGFKRRVGLAQALLHDPDVLILDEPTDGLDPNQKHEVRALIRGMAANKAIVISTHILEEVEAVCTRAMIIAQGRIVADGTPLELEQRSRHHNAITVVLDSDGLTDVKLAAICATFEGLDFVSGVEVGAPNELGRPITIFSRGRLPMGPEIGQRVDQLGWPVAELRVERGRLDDVFRDITKPASKQAA